MQAILFMHPSIAMVAEAVDDDSILFIGREFARQSGDDICAIFRETENRQRDYPIAAEAYGLACRLNTRILLVGPPDINPFDDRLTIPHGPQIIHLGISGTGRLETAIERSSPETGIPSLLPEGSFALVVTEDDEWNLFTPSITDANADKPIPYFACVLMAIGNKLGDEEWTNGLVEQFLADSAG